jgi:Transposase DDE domain
MQGDNGQARVESKHQGIVQAAACGHGQDYGPGAPRREGAKANGQAIRRPPESFAGKRCSADSNDQSAAHLQTWVKAQREADMPAPHVRPRAPRFATQARHTPGPQEQCTLEDLTYEPEHECSGCPKGQCFKLEARRHKLGHNLYRSYEADAAAGAACPLRDTCLQHAKPRRKHRAVLVEPANKTLAPQRSAKSDTPEARAIYGQRLALVEPVFGNLRSQKR